MKNTKVYLLILTSVIIGMILSITISYTLAETIIDSKNVYYKDNSNLLADNVQDAIDGTCTKFESKVDSFLDKIYPVGSIYITTTLSTTAQVKEALGGEWAVYGDGRTLLSSSGKSEQTGGTNTVTLTTDNLPEHTHDISHTHTTPQTNTSTMSLTAETAGEHIHNITSSHGGLYTDYLGAGTKYFVTDSLRYSDVTSNGFYAEKAGNHTHKVSGTVTIPSLSTDSISRTSSGSTGGSKSFSVQDAYITVYMYKRTK